MKDKRLIFEIVSIVITCLMTILVIIVIFFSPLVKLPDGFVTGYYAKYCYRDGEENKNIKEKLHYQTLEECGKPLK